MITIISPWFWSLLQAISINHQRFSIKSEWIALIFATTYYIRSEKLVAAAIERNHFRHIAEGVLNGANYDSERSVMSKKVLRSS
jgi:hypothetical protein